MKFCKFNKKILENDQESGAAALEYVLVTMFGLVFSIAAIAFVSEAMNHKFDSLEEKIGIEFDTSSLNPFSESKP